MSFKILASEKWISAHDTCLLFSISFSFPIKIFFGMYLKLSHRKWVIHTKICPFLGKLEMCPRDTAAPAWKLECKLLLPSQTRMRTEWQGNTICPFHYSSKGCGIKSILTSSATNLYSCVRDPTSHYGAC